MNILLAINNNYISQTKVLLNSILKSNQNELFNVYIMNKELTADEKNNIINSVNSNIKIKFITIDNNEINKFPVYEKRYPVEIYFRLFASIYLPKSIDRILYLDVDTIVINSLKELYNMDFDNNLFIGATHIKEKLHKFNVLRFGVDDNYVYVNTGVLLMNLSLLRKINLEDKIINFVNKNKNKLLLPDQDTIFALFGNRIKQIDSLKYNLGDKEINLHNLYNKNKIDINWVKNNSVIIHYYGRNKPWNRDYKGILDYFYNNF